MAVAGRLYRLDYALTESSEDLTLYNADSDTIYLYNPYQLAVLNQDDPSTEPVLDGDAHADSFGTGQLFIPMGKIRTT